MAEREEILDGIAVEIWRQASGLDRDPTAPGERRARRLTATPAAVKAARDLAGLYESLNSESVQAMNARTWADDPDVYGERLARGALDEVPRDPESRRQRKHSARQRLVDAGVVVPWFSVHLEAKADGRSHELVWEGDADEGTPVFDVEGFPRTGHRLVKPNENKPRRRGGPFGQGRLAGDRGHRVGERVTVKKPTKGAFDGEIVEIDHASSGRVEGYVVADDRGRKHHVRGRDIK